MFTHSSLNLGVEERDSEADCIGLVILYNSLDLHELSASKLRPVANYSIIPRRISSATRPGKRLLLSILPIGRLTTT